MLQQNGVEGILNSKRQTIVFLSALVLLVLVLAIVITWHFLRPFAFAVILAVVFYPLHQRMLRFTKGTNGNRIHVCQRSLSSWCLASPHS